MTDCSETNFLRSKIMLQYTIIDLYLPRLTQGKYVSSFVATGHYLNNDIFNLAIHFYRLSEWIFIFKIEGSNECDPERVYKTAWKLTFLGVSIDYLEL